MCAKDEAQYQIQLGGQWTSQQLRAALDTVLAPLVIGYKVIHKSIAGALEKELQKAKFPIGELTKIERLQYALNDAHREIGRLEIETRKSQSAKVKLSPNAIAFIKRFQKMRQSSGDPNDWHPGVDDRLALDEIVRKIFELHNEAAKH